MLNSLLSNYPVIQAIRGEADFPQEFLFTADEWEAMRDTAGILKHFKVCSRNALSLFQAFPNTVTSTTVSTGTPEAH